MKWALMNKRYIHADEAGKLPNKVFTCPACGEQVVLKKGNSTFHYFSHMSNTDCGGEGLKESKIHYMFKESFISLIGKTLVIPRGNLENLYGEYFWLNEEMQYFFKPLVVTVNDVWLERSLGCIRPDVILKTNIGDILIEIAYTHFINNEKLSRIKKLGYLCVEMSADPEFLSEEELKSGNVDIQKYMRYRTNLLVWINDSFYNSIRSYIKNHSNIYKTCNLKTQKGKICKGFCNPPCVPYKTKYAFTCRNCPNLIYLKKDPCGQYSEVCCGYGKGFNKEYFSKTYFK